MTDKLREAQTLPLFSETDKSLDIDRQRRLAKALRNKVRDGCAASISRLRTHHPRFSGLALETLKLSDAQLTLAREAGLSSWPALKTHVAQMEAARTAIETGAQAPDHDLPTLHIRCGNDIEAGLRRAGFCGDLMFLGALLRLRDAGQPALASGTVGREPDQWGKAVFSLTQTGNDLLAGAIDWKDCAPRERIQGGIRLFNTPDWRWDRDRQMPSSH